MKLSQRIFLGLLPLIMTSCGDYYGYSPSASPSAYPGEYGGDQQAQKNLASLFTGEIINQEEQLLRDTLKRQIILDFPVKVGIIYYQLNSQLDAADQETTFDNIRQILADSGQVSETVKIPPTLLSGDANLDGLRRLGARFQTDILILVTGSHSFTRTRVQNLSFWDSFSDQVGYESQINFEAIALDVYTGTLLNPFKVSTKGEAVLLGPGATDYVKKRYEYQKKIETQAWSDLGNEAKENLISLRAEVDQRKAELEKK